MPEIGKILQMQAASFFKKPLILPKLCTFNDLSHFFKSMKPEVHRKVKNFTIQFNQPTMLSRWINFSFGPKSLLDNFFFFPSSGSPWHRKWHPRKGLLVSILKKKYNIIFAERTPVSVTSSLLNPLHLWVFLCCWLIHFWLIHFCSHLSKSPGSIWRMVKE